MVSCSVESGANSPLPRLLQPLGPGRALCVGEEQRRQIVDRHLLAGERRRHRRERLRRPGLLARHGALRRSAAPRSATAACRSRDRTRTGSRAWPPGRRRRSRRPFVRHRDQLRRRGEVVVPQVVVHDLEVPQALAGAGVERDQASSRRGCCRCGRRRSSRRSASRSGSRRCRGWASIESSPQVLAPPTYFQASFGHVS